jgi:predicted short-subunit dehydrogenase-like oxidoreductase (DUF2520 family)
MSKNKISFAGAGRVAGVLCEEIFSAGHIIELIVSESTKYGHSLADSCNAGWSSDLIFPDSSEVIIVSVPDHRLKEVLDSLRCGSDTLVVHTAGSTGLDIFPEHLKRTGVFYPLQTFSHGRKVDFSDLPIFIESSDSNSLEIMGNIARSIGGTVYFADAEHRRILHLAAVFVCNFTNHMLTIGKDLAESSGFNFDVLLPLINETISKAEEIGPDKSQTGPAVRHDKNVIKKHLELLSFSSELHGVYSAMTRSITKYYNMV